MVGKAASEDCGVVIQCYVWRFSILVRRWEKIIVTGTIACLYAVGLRFNYRATKSRFRSTWPWVPRSRDEPRSGQGRPSQGQSHHAEHWLLGGQYPTPKGGHRQEDSSVPVKTPARVGGPWIQLHHTSSRFQPPIM